jgi:NAD(P)-dependent dehydrogenase (short-subunit alcohol dehydrogenase family)
MRSSPSHRPLTLCDHALVGSQPGEADQAAAAAAARPPRSRTGQVALVTGGSAGLGLAIARALARAGSAVVLASRSAERCRQAAARLSAETGRTVAGRPCDVTDERAVGDLVDQVMAGHGRLDVLVTSAGVQARGTVEQLDVATLRACLDVNVVGTSLNTGLEGDPPLQRILSTEVLLGRWAEPEELTGAAMLLTDPQAGYLTGAVLSVDGGWTAH